LSDEKESISKQNVDLKESLEKLVDGKKKVEMFLGNQINFGEKQGIGFYPFQSKSNKTIFVKVSHQKSISRKSFPKNSFLRNRSICYYCGKHGHSINKFFIRNNPTRFKQIWVPKDILYANKNEPKKVRVSKGAT